MIAVLSDIHGNLEALESVIDYCYDYFVNRWIILGDLVDYGADSAEVVKLLSSLDNVECIRGNHDDAVLRRDCSRFTTEHGKRNFEITLNEIENDVTALNLLSKMTESCKSKIDHPEFEIVAVHGSEDNLLWGRSPKVIPTNAAAKFPIDRYQKIVLGGHSHVSGYYAEEGSLYVNPGSVGQPRNGDPRSQFIICNDDFTKFKFCAIEYDIDKAATKIYNSGRPKFLATRLYLGI